MKKLFSFGPKPLIPAIEMLGDNSYSQISRTILSFFYSFILLFLLFSVPHVFADEEKTETGIFSAMYQKIGDDMNKSASEKVATLLHADPKLVQDFIEKEQLTDKEENTLLQVCQHEDNEGDESPMTKTQKADCLANIQKMWEGERSFIRNEVLQTEKSIAFSRYLDGQLDSKTDFDVYSDIHLLDRQFFDENASNFDVPTANKGNQKKFSLVEFGYRLPSDALPFKASGGCEKGETSLYGGLVCLPKFCSDFMCIKVKALPGRKGASNGSCGGRSKASVENIICGLEEVTNVMKDSKQLTPTRNTNQSHWINQIFDSFQNLKSNISFEPKTPPILSEFTSPDSDSKKKEYEYAEKDGKYILEEKTSSDKKEETETEKMEDEIRAEFDRVRRDEFNVCGNGKAEDCKNEDVLKTFFYDCGLFESRNSSGPLYDSAKKCGDEKLQLLELREKEKRDARQKMVRNIKMDFYEDMPKNLDKLNGAISTFEDTMNSINLCKIQQAKYRCGGIKMDCSLKDSNL